MTPHFAHASIAADRAVPHLPLTLPPDLQDAWTHALRRRPGYLVHRTVHLTCGLLVGSVLKPGATVPLQAGRSAPLGPEAAQEHALTQSLRSTFGDLGDVPGDGPVFVRVTRGFLAGDLPVPARPGRVVAEVDGLGACDDVVRDGLLRLKGLGCRVALGDFTGRPDQRSLLPFADYVKIDSRDLDLEGRPLLDLASSRGAQVVAELVDSRDALEQCRAAGIPLVQGRVFEPGAPPTRTSVLSSATGG